MTDSPLPPVPLADGIPSYLDRIRWIEVTNTESTAAPGCALLRTTGGDADGTIRVAMPDAAGQSHLMVAHPNGVPASGGGVGLATYTDLVPAAYLSTDGTPAVGETWGSAAGEWKLRKGNAGYRVTSTPVSSNGLLLVEVQREASDEGTDDSGNGPGNGTDALGHSIYCQELDSYGGRTGRLLRRETRPDRSVRCVPLDDCCASNWYCIRNATVEGLCCDGISPFVWTKYLKLTFSAKTGAATELPDSIILVYQSGGYGYESSGHLWTGSSNATFPLGLATVTGGIVFDCSGSDGYGYESESEPEIEAEPTLGTLYASLDLTGFEPDDGTAVEVPCEPSEEDFPISLGSFAYTETTTNGCGIEKVRTGTVEVSFETWKEDGAVEFTASPSVVPPWDAESGPYKTEDEAVECCPQLVTLPCFDGQTFEMPETVFLDFLEVTDRQNGATGWPFGATAFGTLTVPNTIPLVYNGTEWKFAVPSGAACGDQFPYTENDNSGASCGTYSFGVDCVSGVSKTAVAAGANGVSPSQTLAADDADPFFDTSASPTTSGWRFQLTMIPLAGPPAPLVVTFLVSHPTLGTGVREWFKPATNPLKSPTDSGGLSFEANVFVNVALGAAWKVRGRVRW